MAAKDSGVRPSPPSIGCAEMKATMRRGQGHLYSNVRAQQRVSAVQAMQEGRKLGPPIINQRPHLGVWESIRETTHDEVVHRGPIIQKVGYGPDVTRCTRFSEGRYGHPGWLNLSDTPAHMLTECRSRHQTFPTMGTDKCKEIYPHLSPTAPV